MGVIKGWDVQKSECEEVARPGIVILGYVEPWNGAHTKLKLKCEKHGEWDTTSINNFKKNGSGCKECRSELTGKRAVGNSFGSANSLPDEEHITNFKKMGVYPEGTTFTRTDKKRKGKNDSFWLISCPVCANDAFSKAGFRSAFESTGTHIKNGQIACRCSKAHIYFEDEWLFRFKLLCEEKGYTFIQAFYQGEAYSHGSIEYSCPEHGLQKMAFKNLLTGRGCPECANKTQQQCYINRVFDMDGKPYALKFGIANDSERRVKVQNYKNKLTMEQERVYLFPTVEACKKAEKHCKEVLECGVVSKEKMQDGWTETTYLLNFTKIIEIYESFGGELQK